MHQRSSEQEEQRRANLARLREAGVEVTWRLLYGSPADEIGKFARQERLDMLIMGSHGHKGLADVVHGTTVSPVRHALEIPVMVVPAAGGASAEQQRGDESAGRD